MHLSSVDNVSRSYRSAHTAGRADDATPLIPTGTVIPYNAPTASDFENILRSVAADSTSQPAAKANASGNASGTPTHSTSSTTSGSTSSTTSTTSGSTSSTTSTTSGSTAGSNAAGTSADTGGAGTSQTVPAQSATGNTQGISQAQYPYLGTAMAMQPVAYMLVPVMAVPMGLAVAGGAGTQTATGATSQAAAPQAATGSSSLAMPFSGQYSVTQGYGPTDFTAEPSYDGYTHFHTGIDYGLPQGTEVKAAASGKVIAAGWTDVGYGNEVMIDHGNGVVSLYGHLSQVDAKVGDTVQAGQEIGLSGSTGNSTGPHLHFGVEVNGKWVDPTPYLNGSTSTSQTPLTLQTGGTLGTTMSSTTPIYMMPIMPMLQSYGGIALMPVQYGSAAGSAAASQAGQAASSPTAAGQQQSTSGVGGADATSGSWAGGALNSLIEQAAQTSGVSASLLSAVVQAESGGDPNAESSAGAKGLMQLMDGTASTYGVSNSFDPQQNLAGGSQYLRTLLDQYSGNEQLALAAYNAGPGAVSAYGGVPPYSETQNYIQKVMQLQQEYSSSGQP